MYVLITLLLTTACELDFRGQWCREQHEETCLMGTHFSEGHNGQVGGHQQPWTLWLSVKFLTWPQPCLIQITAVRLTSSLYSTLKWTYTEGYLYFTGPETAEIKMCRYQCTMFKCTYIYTCQCAVLCVRYGKACCAYASACVTPIHNHFGLLSYSSHHYPTTVIGTLLLGGGGRSLITLYITLSSQWSAEDISEGFLSDCSFIFCVLSVVKCL